MAATAPFIVASGALSPPIASNNITISFYAPIFVLYAICILFLESYESFFDLFILLCIAKKSNTFDQTLQKNSKEKALDSLVLFHAVLL